MEHASPVDHAEDPQAKRHKREADFTEFLNENDESGLVEEEERQTESTSEASFKYSVNLALLKKLHGMIANVGKQLDMSVRMDGSIELKCTNNSRTNEGYIVLYDVDVITPANKSFSLSSAVFMSILNAMSATKTSDNVTISLINSKIVITNGTYTNTVGYAESVDDMEIDPSSIMCSTSWQKETLSNIFTKSMVGTETNIKIEDGKVYFTSTNDDQEPSVVMPIDTSCSYDESVENASISVLSKFKTDDVELRLSPDFIQFHSTIGGDSRNHVQYTAVTQAKDTGGYF